MKHKTKIPQYSENKTKIPNLNDNKFRWTIKSEDYKFHFTGSEKISIKSFINNTIKKLNSCEEKTWEEIGKLNHSHKVSIKETTCEQVFKNLINSKNNLDSITIEKDDFYQIALDGKHRLIGYRQDGIFHLFMNDPNHELFSDK